ncbi:M56 family metallopeptidase [Pedobacter aquatilis]|uniref:M56 family metallopeptidase n=1 Tax=Pedobacter aquatilis TaxID=351343 RepID=UPI0029310E6F|nr:M56 family metallopeptidase [Pedobacter aquatilis]
MPHFFIVLFKINLVLILFAAAYYLVLRKLTFYVLNRVFLLFGILFSTIYPFINLTEFFTSNESLPAFVPGLNQNVKALIQFDAVSFLWQVLTFLFYAGVVFMASRLVLQFISLHRIHKNSHPGIIDRNKVRILKDEVSPFSFWQTIYINPALHTKTDLNSIIEHEKVHVEEWHTIDIILSELSLVFHWFNPGVWLMKKAVRENIEFITDAKILKGGIDKKAYQYSLLGVGTLQSSVAIVNNFNLSDLKKRILMMNVKRSSKVNLTRYIFLLPVLLCLTLAFTVDKKDVKEKIAVIKQVLIADEKDDKPLLEIAGVPKKSTVKKVKVKTSQVSDSAIRVINMIRAISMPADSLRLVSAVSDRAKPVFIEDSKHSSEDLVLKLKGVVKGIQLSETKSPEKEDKKLAEVVVIGYARKAANDADKKVRFRAINPDSVNTNLKRGYVIVNGEFMDKEKLNTIDPNSIKTITVVGKPLKQ